MRRGAHGMEAADGSMSHAAYLSINPFDLVPALSVTDVNGDHNVILETPALLQMIGHLTPEGEEMLGTTAVHKASVVEWCTWLSGTLHATGFRAVWRPDKFLGEEEDGKDEARKVGRKKVEESFQRIEQRLTGREFAVGDKMTVVDVYLYLFWHWGDALGLDMASRYLAYGDVLRKVERLEGVKGAMEQNGFEPCFEGK